MSQCHFIGDCPQSLLPPVASELSGIALLSLKVIQAWGSIFCLFLITLKCMLHTHAAQRIWVFSKLPVCSGFK